VCDGCPVKDACLAEATTEGRVGVWGGRLFHDHGRSSYTRGCRCYVCRSSNAAYTADYGRRRQPAMEAS
jgi:hypothetical protein